MKSSFGRSQKSWVSPTWLQNQQERLRLSSRRQQIPPTETLLEFIPRVSPNREAPVHLKPYLDVLESAPGAGLKIVFAAPPQHGKTESTSHALVRWLLRHPELRYAYATYNDERTQRVSRNALDIATRADLSLKVSNLGLWKTSIGGQLLWTSVNGGFTGEPVDGAVIVDDPTKDRKEAESATIRQNHKDWYHGTVESRVHPGASILVMATRWHADDLPGYLIREQGFRYINLKAIADIDRPPGDNRQVGEALWPHHANCPPTCKMHRPLEFLQERQRGNPWNFAALFQGQPRPRGGALFKDATYYTELPVRGFRVLYGCDLAYSEKSHADFSVLVELWVVPPETEGGKPLIYVVNVDRKQVDAPSFALTLKARHSQRAGRILWIASGTELGAAAFIKKSGVPLVTRDPGGRDKFARAQGTAELWNLGRILVPADSEAHPWVDIFVDEICNFTGVKDPTDDQVDALVSGVEEALQLDDLTLYTTPGRYS